MQATTRSNARIDNILRQKLMIGDPSDATEVARGLELKFADRAEILQRDRSGQSATAALSPISRLASPVESDLAKAKDDVERDLRGLIAEPQLKDVTPELRGWHGAIMRLIEDGAGGAALALDQRQRDRVFDSRRSLGDYARLARLLGAATPQFNGPYRQLAKSIDQVAALILVLAGEAIADKGATALPAPASDLRARRDAVLAAVRTLNGSAEKIYGTDEWPRGLHAYRALQETLQESGHGDLRSVLNEQHLGRTMDALIDQATGNNAYALRALGATAGVTLGKFERFLELAGQPDPESPPLATLRNALRLFIDSFQSDATARLVVTSRPALLAVGYQGVNFADVGQQRLFQIIHARGQLSLALDCFLGCDCNPGQVKCQVVLDKLLYDADRATDLYLQSRDGEGDGPAEQRAAAFGVLIDLLARDDQRSHVDQAIHELRRVCLGHENGHSVKPKQEALVRILQDLADLLLMKKHEETDITDPEYDNRRQSELCMQRRNEARWIELAASMAPGCVDFGEIGQAIDNLLAAGLQEVGAQDGACPVVVDDIPPDVATSLAGWAYERPSEGN
ncbi:MAG: hypothetical protein OEU92_06030 [Alphaproteobacteria bacterium]|nr:hypothetical protein [Alphaproteobacteria bacterium]